MRNVQPPLPIRPCGEFARDVNALVFNARSERLDNPENLQALPSSTICPVSSSPMICVTGAEGFIGSHLVEALLDSGHEVRALVQYNSFNSIGWLRELKQSKGLEIVFGDIRDSESMISFADGAQSIFHLAALIAIPYSYKSPSSYVETNVLGTLSMLNAARRVQVERFIHTSTSEVYGTARTVPISEDHPLQGQSPYSASKIGADAIAHSFWASYGLPVVTLRPFNTYGPRQSLRAVIPTLLSQVIAGAETVSLGSTETTRDFTYVADTVSGFIAAGSTEGIEGETINLGTGYEISIAGLVDLVGEVFGRRIEVLSDPLRVRPASSEVERLLSDNSKAKSLLGWTPEAQGIDGLTSGLRKTADWLRPLVENGSVDSYQYVQ